MKYIEQKDSQLLSIYGKDGRLLLGIERDGTVIGEVKDASEAAQIFSRYLQDFITLPYQEQSK